MAAIAIGQLDGQTATAIGERGNIKPTGGGTVMRTTNYRVASAMVQLLSILMILVNIASLVCSFYYNYLMTVEAELTRDYIVTYYTMGIYTICLNILVGLFATCVVTSGNKIFMTAFTKSAILAQCVVVLFSVYFYFFHVSLFNRSLSATAGKPSAFSAILPYRNSIGFDVLKAPMYIQNDFEYVVNRYILLQVISLAIFFSIVMLTKYIRGIQLYVEPPKAPAIVEISRRGLNTTCLENRHVVEVA